MSRLTSLHVAVECTLFRYAQRYVPTAKEVSVGLCTEPRQKSSARTTKNDIRKGESWQNSLLCRYETPAWVQDFQHVAAASLLRLLTWLAGRWREPRPPARPKSCRATRCRTHPTRSDAEATPSGNGCAWHLGENIVALFKVPLAVSIYRSSQRVGFTGKFIRKLIGPIW